METSSRQNIRFVRNTVVNLMRILITGGTGLLGWNLVQMLSTKEYEIVATYHITQPQKDFPNVEWIQIDLARYEDVSRLVAKTKPAVVVHTAAHTDVDDCEVRKDLAYRINYEATKALAKACKDFCEHFIYVSTDYVFDGAKGLYREEDLPNPINYYGLTKLLGEVAVESLLENYLIIRTSNIYGCSPSGKKGFALNTLEKLLLRNDVKAICDQYLSPTYAPDLANNIVEILRLRPRGVIHLAGERVSRYNFALEIAKTLGLKEDSVRPVSFEEIVFKARRPRDSSLDISKARSLGLSIRPFKESVREFVEKCSSYAIQRI